MEVEVEDAAALAVISSTNFCMSTAESSSPTDAGADSPASAVAGEGLGEWSSTVVATGSGSGASSVVAAAAAVVPSTSDGSVEFSVRLGWFWVELAGWNNSGDGEE
jgi:hypothetical protein